MKIIDPLEERERVQKRRTKAPYLVSVPVEWLLAALKAKRPLSVARLCLAYWYRRLTRKDRVVRLSNEYCDDFDLSGMAKRRAIDSAVDSGLLQIVERHTGRSPLVRLPDEWEHKL
jgi:hypothetical protein